MILGVDYYPEHWPQERWEKDAQLMHEAGITRVRMAEFSWHKMEPTEGRFDFAWLKEAMELLDRYGVKTILCTPTPTYPAWLHKKYPDIHQVKPTGQVKEWGQRQDACKNHAGYRRHAEIIVEKIAQTLGNHPAVVAWQTDNEFGCHGTARCYCANCERAFQEWLRKRFKGNIAAANAAWGTFFWSHDYNDFDEIMPPRDTADRTGNDGQNPGLVLDFYRFSSDVQVAFQREQVELLRKHSPGRIITHNLMGLAPQTNYYDLSADLDIVSWDNYVFEANGTNKPPVSLGHDLMRGAKRKNVWVMEQGSGTAGWGRMMATPQPGQMRLWAYQAVAHGAEMISFFRWRSCRWGREQYWHGLLYHHGIPQRRYDEAKQMGKEFPKLAELDGSAVKAEVAILWDYDCVWALETQPNAGGGFGYVEIAKQYSRLLSRLGIVSDAISPWAPLSDYKVVIAPCMHVCPPELAERLKAFVQNGGTLILGPRSGVKDRENAIFDELLPGPLRQLAGCHVEEYDAFSTVLGLELKVKDAAGEEFRVSGIADVLAPETGKAFLWYVNHYFAGKPAAVRNIFGKGQCIYVGSVLDDTAAMALLRETAREKAIRHRTDLHESIEMVRRVKQGQSYAFYLNHNVEGMTVNIERPGVDLISGAHMSGNYFLPGFGVAIVKEVAG